MILITGGSGFLGLNLAWHLANKGEKVLLFDPRPVEVPSFLVPFWDNQVRGVVGDIMDLPNLLSTIEKYSIESIIHAAYYQFTVSGERGTVYQLLKANLEGTTNVLEAGRIFHLRRVSFISSFSVYFGTKSILFHEELDLPLTFDMDVQGIKHVCEQICLPYVKEYGLSLTILRPDRFYGPLSHGRRFPIRPMIENAVAHKPSDFFHIYGGNKAAYTYAKDTAKAISLVHLAKAPKHIIYNVGEGNLYNYFDFAQAIKEVIPSADIRLGTTALAKDMDLPPMNIERLKKEMEFIPDYDLKLAIKDYIHWLREGKY